MKILLIVPAYNEEMTILETVKSIQHYSQRNRALQIDYLVINDGSTDQTKQILETNQIPAIHLIMNLGIGGAVQTGYKYAAMKGYDIAVQIDGDGQHDVESLGQVLTPILTKEADFVIGSRFLPDERATFQTTFMRRVGIRILSFLISLFFKRKIYDVTSGYRAANREVLTYFSQHYPPNYPEPESTTYLLKKKYTIAEVPVNMKERTGGRSSIQAWTSVRYMLEVSLAIVVASFRKEGK